MTIHLYRCNVCRDTIALTSEEASNLEDLRKKPGNENRLTFVSAPHALCDGTYLMFARFEADQAF